MFEYRLSKPDEESYLLLLDSFYKFKQHVCKKVDDLELSIKSILQNLWKLQPTLQQLNSLEEIVKQSRNSSIFDIDQLTQLANKVMCINNDKLDKIYQKQEHLHLQCAQMRLKSSKYQFDNLIASIQDSYNDKQQLPTNPKETSVIWKYTQVHIDKQNFSQIQQFNYNYVHVETLIPLQHLMLVSVYQSILFNGNHNTYGTINSQKQTAYFTFRVHEGYDTSACIYKEIFEINHHQFSGETTNSCYKLQLNQSVYLKKGLVYSFSMTNETKQDFNTIVHHIKGPTYNSVKFLGKETEHMCLPCYFGTIKQSLVNSSMPGFEVTQFC